MNMLPIRLLFLIGLVFLARGASAQNTLYATPVGQTQFFSETPAENISAINKKTQVILNTTTGEIAVLMTMRDFDFPNELMEEHFNENYIESEKYPKSTFRGKLDQILDFSKNGTYDVSATGVFTVHGQSQSRKIEGKVTVDQGSILIATAFEVALADHKIEVPKIVFVKIAQIIQVKTLYNLKPYKK